MTVSTEEFLTWKCKPLGEIVQFLDSMRIPLKETDRAKRRGSIPYYGANGQVDWINEYIFDEPLVLLAEDGGFFGSKDHSIAYKIEGKSWVNNHAHVLRPKPEIDIDYLHWILSYYDVTPFLSGSTRFKLTKTDASRIPVSFPKEIQEQKRIAEILNKADKLKQKREQANQMASKILQAVFLQMFGDPANNEKKFSIEKLGDFAEFAMGGTPNPNKPEYYGGDTKWLKGSDIEQEFIYDVPKRITKEGLLNSNAKIYDTGTVVVGRTGQGKTRGKTAILRVPAATNETMIAIMPKNSLLPEYLQQNLKLRYRELRNFGGQNQRGGITQSHLRNLPLAVPPIELQKRFAELVTRVERITEKQSESSCEINELFKSLMSKAFKGDLVLEAKQD